MSRRWNGFLVIMCFMMTFLTVASAAADPAWGFIGPDTHLRIGELSASDLGGLVWSKTAAPHPRGYVIKRDGILGEPITMQVTFELADRLPNYNQIQIAGLLSEPDLSQVDRPVLALRWNKTTTEGRDRWQLQLVGEPGLIEERLVSETTPHLDIVNLSLPAGYPQQGDRYTALFSFDPLTGRLHVALEDDPEGIFPLEFAANLQLEPYQKALYPMSGWEGSNPQGLVRDDAYIIHQLSLRQELAGTGLPLELREELEFALLSPEGERRYISTYYNDQELLASLKWPKAHLPGVISLTFLHGKVEEEIFRAEWAEEEQFFAFPPLSTLPLGEALLVLEYIHNGKVVGTISRQTIRIIGNRATARLELYGRNYRRSKERAHLPIEADPGLYGNVIVSGERPLEGLLDVRSVYKSEKEELTEIAVLSTEIRTGEESGSIVIPFQFALPPGAGEVTLFADLQAKDTAFTPIQQCTKVWAAPLVPAFPGAEGFGAFNPGGRGGRVIRVTNLHDSGPGSLRAAVEAEGPRTVVFDVSGIIELESRLVIANPYITIAGQTAPGGGITIANYSTQVTATDVIMRHLRFRLGDLTKQQEDTLEIKGNNVIVDHVSATWGIDETLSVSDADNVTVQWSLIGQSLNRSIHEKGAHGYGSLVRGERGATYSFHHNLWAHHRSRMPRPGNYLNYKLDPVGLLADFRNNVIYNWEGSYPGANYDTDSISRYNFVGNYYLPGKNSGDTWAFRDENPYARAFFAGNYMDGSLPEDPWSLVRGWGPWTDGYKLDEELPVAPVTTQAAPDAFQSVLAGVGTLPRDPVDSAIIASVIDRTGKIIDSQSEVGGWPVIPCGEAPLDSDQDGIPDWCEEQHGLDPFDPLDAGRLSASGYTQLELYLNSICD